MEVSEDYSQLTDQDGYRITDESTNGRKSKKTTVYAGPELKQGIRTIETISVGMPIPLE